MIDIAEILLKVALSTINQINQIESIFNRTTNCSINMKMQFGWPICVESHFQQYFSIILIVMESFIGGGNHGMGQLSPTCSKSLTKLSPTCSESLTKLSHKETIY